MESIHGYKCLFYHGEAIFKTGNKAKARIIIEEALKKIRTTNEPVEEWKKKYNSFYKE